MSHTTPDTCAFEYTDAYRVAATLPRAAVVAKRKALHARMLRVVEENQPFDTLPMLRAALRGYGDYLVFADQHPALWEGK